MFYFLLLRLYIIDPLRGEGHVSTHCCTLPCSSFAMCIKAISDTRPSCLSLKLWFLLDPTHLLLLLPTWNALSPTSSFKILRFQVLNGPSSLYINPCRFLLLNSKCSPISTSHYTNCFTCEYLNSYMSGKIQVNSDQLLSPQYFIIKNVNTK